MNNKPTPGSQFYAVNLKPYNNGSSRWLVYWLDDGTDTHEGRLVKLWPADCRCHAKAKKIGYTYTTNRNLPAYHIHLKGVGTSHLFLLQEQVAYILHNEYGYPLVDGNDIKMEVLG